MATQYTPKERTSAAIKDGFDRDPDLKKIKNKEVLTIYRAHGDSSKMVGRFFFAPQIEGVARSNWTADMLELELNAALWGNDFKFLATFTLNEGVEYKIGPIAHDKYQGIERNSLGKEAPFDQYSYFRNANMFFQIEIPAITQENWHTFLKLIKNEPIKPGRFHSRVGNC